MKSKKHILSFVLLTAIVGTMVFFSCKKDEDNTVTEPTCRVAIIKNDSNVTTTTIEYNADKKPIKVINYNPVTNASTGYTTIEYGGTATITIKTFTPSGVVTGTEVATLNSAGRVTSATKSETNNGITYTSNYAYVYNSSGYLIQETRTQNAPNLLTTVIDYTIALSNVSTETFTTQTGGTQAYSKTFTYYTEKALKFDPTYMGMQVYGKSNANPTKKVTETGSYKSLTNVVKPSFLYSLLKGTKSDYSGTIDYTYEYDSKDYITKVTSVIIYPFYGGIETTKYVYVCS